jgi:rod shape-determining protein MreC
MFFTSGEDRIFPKGLPVGKVTAVKEGAAFQEVYLQPSGVESAPEEVLVIVDPVHQEIPDAPLTDSPVFLGPDVKPDATAENQTDTRARTQADQMMEQYRKLGAAQNHQFGEGGPGTPPPNFNLKVPGVNAPAAPAGAPGTSAATGPLTGGVTGAPALPRSASATPAIPKPTNSTPAAPKTAVQPPVLQP